MTPHHASPPPGGLPVPPARPVPYDLVAAIIRAAPRAAALSTPPEEPVLTVLTPRQAA
ncbi:hypothetical protein SSP35_04_01690 [Streptomyces sp. NBRC 110611]|uniref:hypothetical protein n=1 Tax=Streptomyces sp. NBRC 110611 TaxID=1621259 RepID=UPI000858330D|nr:hypothetical protein [Streptomyces sp. NBRC 110611]GAU67088.1 hypothetical protein SSP35_04_01690 [Streptomyces sp. NBRC 110611]